MLYIYRYTQFRTLDAGACSVDSKIVEIVVKSRNDACENDIV